MYVYLCEYMGGEVCVHACVRARFLSPSEMKLQVTTRC